MDTENSGIKAIPAVAPRFSVHYEGMPGCRFMFYHRQEGLHELLVRNGFES